MMEEGLYLTARRSWPCVLSCEGYMCVCVRVCGGAGVADVWSISGGCDSGTRPANVSPDGTYGGTLLPPCPLMSHIL